MIGILGSGAFGTALATVWAEAGREVALWGRRAPDPGAVPTQVSVVDRLGALEGAEALVAAVPMQSLGAVLQALPFAPTRVVAACKGVDLERLEGPSGVIAAAAPGATAAVLSGPSFAADIRRGLPTALSLGCADPAAALELQRLLSTERLRLYRTPDVVGVELGGALKNVVAIACGAAIGAGLGESARAALMTRGFAEMQRLAAVLGAAPETLTGLSGFGDLALTCSSPLSRNYRMGLSLGDPKAEAPTSTVEGRATAQATLRLARLHGVEMPITEAVAGLVTGQASVEDAKATLLRRALKEE